METLKSYNGMKEELEILRISIAKEQKKGLPFMLASVIIWLLVAIVTLSDLPMDAKNTFVFYCSCPLLPLAWIIGKIIKVDIFAKGNPLGNLGLLFTCNQMIYLLIVMWVFNAVPDKMVMVYAMVFGAHLLPYSWLYKSITYKVFAILLPIAALVIGNVWNATAVAVAFMILDSLLSAALCMEMRIIHVRLPKSGTIQNIEIELNEFQVQMAIDTLPIYKTGEDLQQNRTYSQRDDVDYS